MACLSTVVVDHLDIVSITLVPPEADSPLVVDSDRILTATAAGQLLQSVPWNASKLVESNGRVNGNQFLQRPALYIRWKASTRATGKKFGCLSRSEALDHLESVTVSVTAVKFAGR